MGRHSVIAGLCLVAVVNPAVRGDGPDATDAAERFLLALRSKAPTAALADVTLLPADPVHRRDMIDRVVRTARQAVRQYEPQPGHVRVTVVDGVAVCRPTTESPGGERENGSQFFLVRRDGRWLAAIDGTRTDGLVDAERRVIGRVLDGTGGMDVPFLARPSTEVAAAFKAWQTASRRHSAAALRETMVEPADATDAAKGDLIAAIARAGLFSVDTNHSIEEGDCAVLPALIDFEGAPLSQGRREDAIFMVRQNGRWRVFPPFGDVTTSPTAEALPADQRGRLIKLASTLTPTQRPPIGVQDELMLAAAAGDVAWAQRLVDRGANRTAHSAFGRTALTVAVMADRADFVKDLLAHGVDPAAEPDPPLVLALREGRDAAWPVLVAHGKDLDREHRVWGTPLTTAVRNAKLDAAKALVAAGVKVEPDEAKYPLLHLAVSTGDAAVFAWARQYRRDLKTTDGGPNLLQSLAGGDLSRPAGADGPAIARELLAAGVDPKPPRMKRQNMPDASPLWLAAVRKDQLPLIRTLLTEVRYTPQELGSALNGAVRNGTAETVRALLEAGADPDRDAQTPWPPLLSAATHPRQADMVAMLLEAGCDAEASRPQSGRTALLTAITHSDSATVELLLKRGANVAAIDTNGESSLTLARIRADCGPERSVDIQNIEYGVEPASDPNAGQAVLNVVRDWLISHPGQADRVTAVERAARIVSRPSADAGGAVLAFMDAANRHDVAALRRVVLLPTDRARRLGVLRVVQNCVDSKAPPAMPGKPTVRVEGTLAIVTVPLVTPDGRTVDTPMYAVRREGGWLAVLDFYEGGGLTDAEFDKVWNDFAARDRR